MCFLQVHLARLLAFATVSHVGLTLVGVALLDPAGLAGALLYLVADGLVKASLFVCVGVLQYRLGTLDERSLYGRGRGLPVTFGLLLLGGLALAGLPPFGTFLGKALMEHAAGAAGHAWVAWLFVAASAVSAAAVLRAGLRVFAGWGPPPPGRTEPLPAPLAAPRTYATMVIPAVVLLAAALGLGIVPGAAERAQAAADHFSDRAGYAAAVLEGQAAGRPAAAASPAAGHLPAAVPAAVLTVGLAVALAAVPLRRGRGRGRRGAALRALLRATLALRRLHSGQVGDSVTWLVVGTATLGGLLATLLR
jgi:multicomponent Na+:H+ antiporter subunit D